MMDANIPHPSDRFNTTSYGVTLLHLSRLLALGGGGVLLLLIIISCLSVIGRELFATPLNGDFEFIEMSIAFVVFAFFPWAHICYGHIRVLLFVQSSRRWLCDTAADILFGLLAALLAVYLSLGSYDAYINHQQTAVLGLPLWWGLAATVLPAGLLCLVCSYSAWLHIKFWLAAN